MSEKIAWAAGLFEGEGCSTWNNRNRRVALTVTSTDLDVIERFYRAVGRVGNINGPYQPKNPNSKLYWLWTASKHDTVLEVSEMLRPYLGERRLAKLDQVLAFHTYRDNF
jgi:hypothetical protein